MCFEKQHITWLLETHVASQGGVLVQLPPRLVLAGAVKAHIVDHAKNSQTHSNHHRVEGGREEPGEPRLHGVGDEAAGKVCARRHEERVGDDDADRAGVVAFSPGAESGTQGVTQVQDERKDNDRGGEGTVEERARGQGCGACLSEEVEDAHHGVAIAEDDCRTDGEGEVDPEGFHAAPFEVEGGLLSGCYPKDT